MMHVEQKLLCRRYCPLSKFSVNCAMPAFVIEAMAFVIEAMSPYTVSDFTVNLIQLR